MTQTTTTQTTTTDARQRVADYLLACLIEGRLSADSTPGCVSGVLAAALVRAVRRVDRLARLAEQEGDPFAAADLPAARADVSELAREADLLATTVAEVSGSALLADAQAHDSVTYLAWTIALAREWGRNADALTHDD